MKKIESPIGAETLLPSLVSKAAGLVTSTLATRLLGRTRPGQPEGARKPKPAPRRRPALPARKGGVRHG